MNNTLASLDWSLIPAFIAVAETGSLSAAARQLGSSQPTVGRQIQQIEAALGLSLFTRHPKGFTLNQAGQSVLPAAKAMHRAAGDLALAAAGRDANLRGTVRITASQVVSHYILPRTIARMRRDLPEIAIELVPTDSEENLLFREADIAVRMFQSTQLDVVTRKIGVLKLSLCATRDYLDRRGRPQTPDDIMDHDFVGYDRSDLILRGMRAAGWQVSRDWFTTRCDDQPTYIELVRAGCGIGVVQRGILASDPEIEMLELGLDLPTLPIWLAAPQSTRHSPRIARVWDALIDGLRPFVS